MAGSGVLFMQDMRVHGPLHDTGEQHGGQSSQLDLLIKDGGANQLETCKRKSRGSRCYISTVWNTRKWNQPTYYQISVFMVSD